MTDEIEDLDSQNQEEVITQDEVTVEPTPTEPKEENVDAEALKQQNQNLYEQLRKAQGFVRDNTGKWVKKETQKPAPVVKDSGDLSQSELYALIKSDVNEEDIEEVKIYARSHKISINEALKTPEVKAILGVKADYRKTAEASSIGNSRYGGHKISDEQIGQDISEGKFPDDPEKLADFLQRQRLKKIAK